MSESGIAPDSSPRGAPLFAEITPTKTTVSSVWSDIKVLYSLLCEGPELLCYAD
jgi:hypothetical protein